MSTTTCSGSRRRPLGIKFDAVVTSQQVGKYKPDLSGFHIAQDRMGIAKDRWLHVGESLYHDVGPANLLGIDSVWVKRPEARRRHSLHRCHAVAGDRRPRRIG